MAFGRSPKGSVRVVIIPRLSITEYWELGPFGARQYWYKLTTSFCKISKLPRLSFTMSLTCQSNLEMPLPSNRAASSSLIYGSFKWLCSFAKCRYGLKNKKARGIAGSEVRSVWALTSSPDNCNLKVGENWPFQRLTIICCLVWKSPPQRCIFRKRANPGQLKHPRTSSAKLLRIFLEQTLAN